MRSVVTENLEMRLSAVVSRLATIVDRFLPAASETLILFTSRAFRKIVPFKNRLFISQKENYN